MELCELYNLKFVPPIVYKVGMKVKVRENLICNEKYGNDTFISDMMRMKGKIDTIVDVLPDNKYHLSMSNRNWTPEMLEGEVR